MAQSQLEHLRDQYAHEEPLDDLNMLGDIPADPFGVGGAVRDGRIRSGLLEAQEAKESLNKKPLVDGIWAAETGSPWFGSRLAIDYSLKLAVKMLSLDEKIELSLIHQCMKHHPWVEPPIYLEHRVIKLVLLEAYSIV